jgi:hypothetical protein
MQLICFRNAWLAVLSVVLCLLSGSVDAQQQAMTDKKVDQTLEELVKWLYDKQAEDGAWYGAYHAGPDEAQSKNDWGPSSMALLALLSAGESAKEPKIVAGLKRVTQEEITGLYALSMRTQMLSKLSTHKQMHKFLQADALTLHNSAHRLSRFDYAVGMNIRPSMRIDNSTTQYGVLGVWSADQRGLKAPKDFWEGVVANFFELQGADGGWAYSGNRNTTQSMTLAGLTCLYLAQQHLHREDAKANQQIQAAIEMGLRYLDQNYDPVAAVHGGASYAWMGYARIGKLSGNWQFGGKDVYQDIAGRIVKDNKPTGASIHDASFRLMFLAEARQPVWINKLKLSGATWNNRPNDVYFLNQYMSRYHQAGLNWRVVDIDSDPTQWASAPVLWLSSDDGIAWTDAQVANVKRYLELGGTLIANPERPGKADKFVASIKELAKKMYPELAFEVMEDDHPLASREERGRVPRGVQVLSGGGRALIVLPRQDWGRILQSDEKPGITRHEAWYCMTNLFDQVNEAGLIKPRLHKP